jgi:hypothetical protein
MDLSPQQFKEYFYALYESLYTYSKSMIDRLFTTTVTPTELTECKYNITFLTKKILIVEHRPEYRILLIEASTELRNLAITPNPRTIYESLPALYIRSLGKLFELGSICTTYINSYRPFTKSFDHREARDLELSPKTLSMMLPDINYHTTTIDLQNPYIQDFLLLYSMFYQTYVVYWMDTLTLNWLISYLYQNRDGLIEYADRIQKREHRDGFHLSHYAHLLRRPDSFYDQHNTHGQCEFMFILSQIYTLCRLTLDRLDPKYFFDPFLDFHPEKPPKTLLIEGVNSYTLIEDPKDNRFIPLHSNSWHLNFDPTLRFDEFGHTYPLCDSRNDFGYCLPSIITEPDTIYIDYGLPPPHLPH